MEFKGREQLLSCEDLPIKIIDVPEWDSRLRVRPLTGTQRDRWEMSIVGGDGKAIGVDHRELLVAMSVVDEAGNQLFTEDDIKALKDKNAVALSRVVLEIQEINGLHKAAIEDAEKN